MSFLPIAGNEMLHFKHVADAFRTRSRCIRTHRDPFAINHQQARHRRKHGRVPGDHPRGRQRHPHVPADGGDAQGAAAGERQAAALVPAVAARELGLHGGACGDRRGHAGADPGLRRARVRRQDPRGICVVEDNTETADALREIADKIKKDFIVLAGDLITDVVVHNVADFHRINDATVTMLLKQEPSQREAKAKGEKPRREKDMIDCIGLVEKENRVVLIAQAVHMNEDMYVSKSLLKRRTNFVLHSDLYDSHFYIFSHWVVDLLLEKKYIASIKADLIPHLVRRQFRGLAALPESVREKAVSTQSLASSLSLSTQQYDPEDVVRCFGYTLPANAYCERADTIAAYRAMDAEVGSRLRVARSASFS